MKLVIEEPESSALKHHIGDSPALVTSRIALVEVVRAVSLASPTPEARSDAERLLDSCLLIEITDDLLHAAADMTSVSIRTLDAIHLASAIRVEAEELVAYDRRLVAAASERGLRVASPAG